VFAIQLKEKAFDSITLPVDLTKKLLVRAYTLGALIYAIGK